MSGAGGQTTLIIRRTTSSWYALDIIEATLRALAFRNALQLLMEAVPRRN